MMRNQVCQCDVRNGQFGNSKHSFIFSMRLLIESHREKTDFLHMRKQRR